MHPIKKDPTKNPNSVNHENGFLCGVLVEPFNDVKFDKADCETVYQGQNNSWIVFGRDRPGTIESGYGARGHGKDSMIDIVVGRLSAIDASTLDGKVNPNPTSDAARLYLSQKCDVDDAYNLAAGLTGKARAQSTALLKADDVRIVARNSLKLVTKTDAFTSANNKIMHNYGVQLIGNNDDTNMQPIPKGANLADAINAVIEKIVDLNGLVKGFMEIQREFNRKITNHTHHSPFWAKPTLPSADLLVSGKMTEVGMNLKVEQGLTAQIVSMYNVRGDYLLETGTKYINSSYHFLN